MDTPERQALFNRAAIAQYIQKTTQIGLDSEERAEILGVSAAEIDRFLQGDALIPSRTLTRVQIVVGVAKALATAIPDHDNALQWLRARGSIKTVDASPLELLCSVTDQDAMKVLNYLNSMDLQNSSNQKEFQDSSSQKQRLDS